jgi:hypothetical protein
MLSNVPSGAAEREAVGFNGRLTLSRAVSYSAQYNPIHPQGLIALRQQLLE